ncbi:MAG: PAS domain S-box protein [Candidatus Omnitrophica bacterium]|nr:PAS domain S-box protein [Candidatus Omnitrophota bacterium]
MKTKDRFSILSNLSKEISKIFSKQKILNSFFSVATDGFCINYKGKIVYCNEKYAEIFGYKPEEIIGKEILNFVSQEEKDLWRKIIKSQKEGDFEVKCIKKDGSEIYLKIIVKNIKYKNKILRISAIRNITEEKINLLKIKESEEKYKILTETLLDGIVVINFNGDILFSNIIGANLFGFEKVEDFLGKNIYDFISEKLKFEDNLALIYKNKGGYSIEYEIIDKKGVRFFIEIIGRKIVFMGQESILLCFRDVTERKIMIENLKEAIGKTRKMLNQSVMALSETLTHRDPYTSIHQKRVSKIAVEIAKELGFTGNLIEGIKIASLLHDIGKIYIPSDILSKPGELTQIEWEFIRMHPEYGANIVKNIEFPWDIPKIIYQHHERINGSGYPQKLKGEDIILEAKILSVADVIEAMSSHRPYRAKYTINEAIQEIEKNSGSLYDKDVVKAVLKSFEKGFDFADC